VILTTVSCRCSNRDAHVFVFFSLESRINFLHRNFRNEKKNFLIECYELMIGVSLWLRWEPFLLAELNKQTNWTDLVMVYGQKLNNFSRSILALLK